jgi:hypothetical protein
MPRPTPRRPDMLPSPRPSDYPAHHSQPSTSPQPLGQVQDWPMATPNQHSYPSYTHSSHVEIREPPTPPNPAGRAQVHGRDSPPALVRAVAPWVIASNLDVGQIYEEDERTPISRPFDVGPMGRSASHVVPLGRFFDEGSQPPLGKHDCKFCGKLFNRPSSLRVIKLGTISNLQQADNQFRSTSIAIRVKNVSRNKMITSHRFDRFD